MEYSISGIVCNRDFTIQYCKSLRKRDFTFNIERLSTNKKGKHEYLNDAEAKD
ncbi:MAG: hypothetical protein ABSA79_04990 [Candidatus Bathyarchaeia archaeon]